MYVLVDPLPSQFRLQPVEDGSEAFCLGGNNCLHNPDFNVAFYTNDGGLTGSQTGPTFNGWGPVEGTVPADADYAMVWLGAGFNEDFVFLQGCQ